MPHILILGGSGKVARFITSSLLQNGHQVTSLIRQEEQIPSLLSLGAKPIVHSLETSTVSSLASLITTHTPDNIIFCAGAGLRAFEDDSLSLSIDRDGAVKLFDAMVLAGVTKRLILISTIDARNREKGNPGYYTEADSKKSDELWGMLPIYMQAKYEADLNLVEGNGERGLEYTIVRPTWYGEGEGKGKVKAGKTGFGEKVSREDVASVVVQCVENEGTIGCVFEVCAGEGEVEIGEVVRRVVEGKIDCFGEELR